MVRRLHLYSNGTGCVKKWDGNAGTGDVRTWGVEEVGRGDSGKWRCIFTICSTFHHISQNPRLLVITMC